MLKLVNEITIGGQSFDYLSDLEVESSWEDFTDTATLTIPRKLRFVKDGEVLENVISGDNPLFKRGDAAEFVVGYDGQVAVRFRGYLSKIIPNNPLTFEFQDAMYLLKQKTVSKYSKKDLTLTQLLTDIVGDTVPIKVNQEFTIGKYAIKSATVAEVLEHLKKNYGVTSYIRDGVLNAGLAYELRDIDQLKIINIDMEKFVIDDGNLSYQRSDDQKIKVKAISIYPDNTREEVTAGDEDGGERAQYFYDVSVEDLQNYANERVEKLKFTGFTGSFTTFINPIVKHGDAIKLISEKRPDATGIYLVKKVVSSSGVGGGRQTIELDIKV